MMMKKLFNIEVVVREFKDVTVDSIIKKKRGIMMLGPVLFFILIMLVITCLFLSSTYGT